jgi:hypothetical protein
MAQDLDSTDKFTLGHHGGLTGPHLDENLSHNGHHITRISPIITFHQSHTTQTPSVDQNHICTYSYTSYISLIYVYILHNPQMQPKLGKPKSLITGCPGAKFPHFFLEKEALL